MVIATTRLPEHSAEAGKDAEVRETIAAMFDATPAQADTIRVTASSVWAAGGHEPELAVDGDPDTRWNTAANTGGNQWLEVEFDAPRHLLSDGGARGFRPDLRVSHRVLGRLPLGRMRPRPAAGRREDRHLRAGLRSESASVHRNDCLRLPFGPRVRSAGREGSEPGPKRRCLPCSDQRQGRPRVFLPHPTAAAIQAALDDAKLVPDVRWEEPVRTSGGNLSYIHKVTDGRDIWFFGNSSDARWKSPCGCGAGTFWSVGTLTQGRSRRSPPTPRGDGDAEVTRVRLSLGPVRSVFLVSAAGAAP